MMTSPSLRVSTSLKSLSATLTEYRQQSWFVLEQPSRRRSNRCVQVLLMVAFQLASVRRAFSSSAADHGGIGSGHGRAPYWTRFVRPSRQTPTPYSFVPLG